MYELRNRNKSFGSYRSKAAAEADAETMGPEWTVEEKAPTSKFADAVKQISAVFHNQGTSISDYEHEWEPDWAEDSDGDNAIRTAQKIAGMFRLKFRNEGGTSADVYVLSQRV